MSLLFWCLTLWLFCFAYQYTHHCKRLLFVQKKVTRLWHWLWHWRWLRWWRGITCFYFHGPPPLPRPPPAPAARQQPEPPASPCPPSAPPSRQPSPPPSAPASQTCPPLPSLTSPNPVQQTPEVTSAPSTVVTPCRPTAASSSHHETEMCKQVMKDLLN